MGARWAGLVFKDIPLIAGLSLNPFDELDATALPVGPRS
jgi:hypothetical protein